jgi:hypothetical protein
MVTSFFLYICYIHTLQNIARLCKFYIAGGCFLPYGDCRGKRNKHMDFETLAELVTIISAAALLWALLVLAGAVA